MQDGAVLGGVDLLAGEHPVGEAAAGRTRDAKPAVVVEKPRSIPLALRGKVEDDGKTLAISSVEAGHALESLTLAAPGKTAIELGSEPRLSATAVEALLPDARRDGNGSLRIKIDARYIEAGIVRRGGGSYLLDYRWESGGLFEGRNLTPEAG